MRPVALLARVALLAGAAVTLCPAADPETAINLPDPLLSLDGKRVRNARDWTGKRRPEILRLYEQHVFGRTPATPAPIRYELRAEKRDALDGLAIRKIVRLYLLGRKDGPWADLLLYAPAKSARSSPAFLGMNYLGNQSITEEPDIPVTPAWVLAFNGVPGIVKNHPTAGSRAAQARRWPLQTILQRGYAVATLCYCEVEPDNADGWKTSLRSELRGDWGAIGVWAFGLSRALDYLEKEPLVDARRVALTGHSRLGKTALWAGAQDTRFALIISNDSGEGGAALARRKSGERIADSVKTTYFWYTPKYREYVNREEALPVDAHFLISLIAPRPVYVASATEDLWADPVGEFLAAKNAEPVYRLFGKAGLGVDRQPPPDRSVGDFIGYHVRTGKHDIIAADWAHHLDFADRHLRK
jgi:hypothetical protein